MFSPFTCPSLSPADGEEGARLRGVRRFGLSHPRSASVPPPPVKVSLCHRGYHERTIGGFSVGCSSCGVDQQTDTPVPTDFSRGKPGRTSRDPGHVDVTREAGVLSLSLTARSPLYGTHEFVCPVSTRDGLRFQALRRTVSNWANDSSLLSGPKVWSQLLLPALCLRLTRRWHVAAEMRLELKIIPV